MCDGFQLFIVSQHTYVDTGLLSNHGLWFVHTLLVYLNYNVALSAIGWLGSVVRASDF